MADIFISYSRTDKPLVAPIVAALEARGWSIWWDMDLAPGEEFDDVTAAALEGSRSVIVIWTPTSVASRWVRGEARVGADRGVLVPVRFQNAKLPIDVRAIHTTDLDDWSGDPQSPSFQTLHQSLVAMLGDPGGGRLPCVGRTAEIETVREMIAKAKRGDGGLLLFSGEAGIGKTRMILEAEKIAKDSNFTVLRGHCSNTDFAPPYEPALEQIEQMARTLGPELMRRAMGDNATEIAKLMPELRQQYSDIPPYPSLPPEQERRYLLHGISEFVARGARGRQPILLVYEDLQWADESTAILLRYSVERLKGEPVLLIGSYRDSELTTASPFGRVLQELVRGRLAEDLRLKRLTPRELLELLVRQFGAEPPPTLVELIYSKTEGNPFFIEEVIRHLTEAGQLVNEAGKFRTDIDIPDTEMTRGVRLIIEDRISRAGSHCRDVLTLAAVVGRIFAFDLLVKSDSTRSEDDILDAIEEAERMQLIEDVSHDRVARYRFVHEQMRQMLLGALSLPRRQRMHLRIAAALESGGPAKAEQVASEIGHHLYQAGSATDGARTAHYLTIAGERAVAALAFEDGLKQFNLALNALHEQGDAELASRLHGLRSEALRGSERMPESLVALNQAIALAPSQAAKDDLTLQRCRLLLDIWRGSEAIDDLEQLIVRARDAGSSQHELRVQRTLARGYYVMSLDHKGFAEKCRDAYERAIALARDIGDRRALALSLIATAQLVDYWTDYRDQANANLDEAGMIGAAIGDEEIQFDVQIKSLSTRGGSLDDAEALLKRLLARRDPIRLNALYFGMMWSTLMGGKLERCAEICDAGIELAYRIGTLPVQYPSIRALALMALGRYDKAWESLDQEIADEDHRFGAALRDMCRLDCEVQLGAYEAAFARAPHVIAESHALVRVWMLQWISSLLAGTTLVFTGDRETLNKIDGLIASTGAVPDRVGRATLALARGDLAGARALFNARALPERMPGFLGKVARHVLLARLSMAEGDQESALEAITTAAALAGESKAEGLLWRILACQAQIEENLDLEPQATEHWEAAQGLQSKIAAAIPDPAHRSALLTGRLASYLGLAR